MSPAERAFVERLRRRARLVSPELARRELAAYELIRRVLSESELIRAINAGTVQALMDEILSDRALDGAFAPLRRLLDTAVADAATMAASDLPSRLRPIAFDALNPRVVEAARQLDIATTGALKSELRETLRETVIAGLEEGKNPRTIATRIRQNVGLAPNQEAAVRNFRRQLETGDRAALNRALARERLRTTAGNVIQQRGHAGSQGLSARDLAILEKKLGTDPLRPDQVDRMVDAYRKRLQAWNAESHARTTALQAQKEGQRLSWEDAIERGVADREMLRQRWITVGDSRVRPEHQRLNGETIPFGGVFSNGERTPGERSYNCRCLARVFVARPAEVAA